MDQPQSTATSQSIEYYIGTLIIGIIIGTVATLYSLQGVAVEETNTYQVGFEAAKKRALESNLGAMIKTQEDVRALSGKVTAINGNLISVRVQSMDPFEDPTLDERIVAVENTTKITKFLQKDQETIKNEMDAFIKKTQSGSSASSLATPPQPLTVASSSIKEMRFGDAINIVAESNIKTVKEFTASEIQIQPRRVIAN